jgi:hypothetical protein
VVRCAEQAPGVGFQLGMESVAVVLETFMWLSMDFFSSYSSSEDYRYVITCLFDSSFMALLDSVVVIFGSFRKLYLLLLLPPSPVSTTALKKNVHDLCSYIFVDWGCCKVIGEH